MTPSQTAHPTEGELLPCPFCGGLLFNAHKDDECAGFGCANEKCSAKPSVNCATGDEALTTWNTRPVVRPQGEEGLWKPISVDALDGLCVEMRMLSTWKARWALDEEGHGFFDRIGDAPRAQTEWRPVSHASDCAVHNMPAMPNGPCDCGADPTALSNQGKPSS